MNLVKDAQLDRSHFEVSSLAETTQDREYWKHKTPEERMRALELLRQIHYGYDPATTRLQRVLEVVDLEQS